jgi:adenosylhomocysteinase
MVMRSALGGVAINGSLHVVTQAGVLIKALGAMGTKVRWCSCNLLCSQAHAAVAAAKAGTATAFAWKGETLSGYWYGTEQLRTVPASEGWDLLVDDGGDGTPFSRLMRLTISGSLHMVM